MPKDIEVISFRCPVDISREIDRRRAGSGISRSEFVRSLLNIQLTAPAESPLGKRMLSLEDRLGEVSDQLRLLTVDLAQTAFWLLTQTALDRGTARKKVKKFLQPKRDE
jgi:hypothetical protein